MSSRHSEARGIPQVPVYNGRLQLPRCLDGLLASDYTNFEVIVVDDCSTDNTREIVESFGARYLRTPRNLGPGGARNLAAQHAEGGILVFVDSDVVVPPKALGIIAEDFDRDPELASLLGSYDTEPAWPDFLSQYKNLMHHYVHQISQRRSLHLLGGLRRDSPRSVCGIRRVRPQEVCEALDRRHRIGLPHVARRQLERKYGVSAKNAVEKFRSRMVDLRKIVEDSVVLPERGYGLKKVAPYAGHRYSNDKAGGAQSIVWFHEYQQDPNNTRIIHTLQTYNQEDCQAMKAICDWLRSLG